MRRVSSVDLMLLGTVLLWSLNITLTKYVFDHGFQPLAYGTIRYFAAISLFWCFTLAREHTLRIRLSDGKLVLIAAAADLHEPDRLPLQHRQELGGHGRADPRHNADLCRDPRDDDRVRAAVAKILARGRDLVRGRRLRGVGQRRLLDQHFRGCTGALRRRSPGPATSSTIAPLVRRYSPFRVSALVLAIGWVPQAITGARQISDQSFHFNTWTWVGFGYAVIGLGGSARHSERIADGRTGGRSSLGNMLSSPSSCSLTAGALDRRRDRRALSAYELDRAAGERVSAPGDAGARVRRGALGGAMILHVVDVHGHPAAAREREGRAGAPTTEAARFSTAPPAAGAEGGEGSPATCSSSDSSPALSMRSGP